MAPGFSPREIEGRVAGYVRSLDLLRSGERPLLMLSGGADSMALLALVGTADRRLRLRLRPAVLHVDYGLRGADSTRDRMIVARACDRLAIPMHELLLEGALQGSDFQQRAREQRFRLARELAAEHGYDVLVTGHTADDQAETVLYRLVKYGAPGALCGMAARAGGIARPLLCLRAAEVRQYCAVAGIEYGDDASNSREAYARNIIRLSAVPALERVSPRAVESVAQAAALARDERELLDTLVGDAWERVQMRDAAGLRESPATLDARALAAEPPALQRLVLRRLAAEVLGEHALVSRRVTAALETLAGTTTGSARAGIGRGFEIVREYDRVSVRGLVRPHPCHGTLLTLPGTEAEAEVEFCGRRFAAVQKCGSHGPGKTDVWLGLTSRARSLVLRHPRAGERFEPLGAGGSVTVLGFLKEQKVPRDARARAMVVELDGHVVWVEVDAGRTDMAAPARPLTGRVAQTAGVSQSTAFTIHVRMTTAAGPPR